MGKKRNTYRVLLGNTEGKRQLGRLHVGGRIIIKWILKKLSGIVWIGFIWLSMATSGVLLNTAMNFWAPWNILKFFSSCATGGFSSRTRLH
jgi:hypothetical protein